MSAERSHRNRSACARRLGLACGKARACWPKPVWNGFLRWPAMSAIRNGDRLDPDHLHRTAAVGAGIGGPGRRSQRPAGAFAKQRGCSIFWSAIPKEGPGRPPVLGTHGGYGTLFRREPGSQFRLIRTIQNRFGAVNELGVFAMTDKGVALRSATLRRFFFRARTKRNGSVVMVT